MTCVKNISHLGEAVSYFSLRTLTVYDKSNHAVPLSKIVHEILFICGERCFDPDESSYYTVVTLCNGHLNDSFFYAVETTKRR